MKLTDESKAFHFGVYAIVRQIPYGKVTSYGHIAYLLDKPQNSRQVGSAMKHGTYIILKLNENVTTESPDYIDVESLPWWRVILSSGKISPREANGQYEQADRLRGEAVAVLDGLMVDLDEYGWFPDEIEY
ncbi:Alkyltransferase-like protein 1 [Candida viswanathii]|uniref:6-O-methylguanine-DNA methyltransferase n=1 Tax=Candida viswanathii TaxID=5486 RepID=A0A367YLS6_9ASCO|nr:Alkyltransferase-like protein 1 [Candida viswanathii]